MTYNLSQMAKKQSKKRNIRMRTRNAPQRMERELLTILRGVVDDPESDAAFTTAVQRAMGWLHSGARWNLAQWERNNLAQLGIDLRGVASLMDSDPEVQKALDWLIALIRDLQVQTSSRIATQLAANAARGLTAAEARAALSAVRRSQLKRAELIAHDQTQKIIAKLNEAQQKEAGITKYVWNHSFLPNARRHHIERQGNVYEWSRPPRDGHPGEAINCRCTASAFVGE